ncbi:MULTISPECIES: hypothetical protein [unclassified Mucilaginibacter]|uniref:hypothetical protein n=1 Tax=unclassified Mucilaginibacter TaxID=2617802 RepID=UPI002AC8E326|nr:MULTISPECIES: hypothetical protein [unclassified Mucilaginibacter]MEB0260207.1 hypothetical protein [Mucilaginibacter sp. 10I4]MEB0277382.1 hypothetical protein [Mucilaginibacter sp. 10B2]MEB0300136.1 hypothetical protein [Mucilaginibacter sp. 5C4]WPX25506.1 hypothetical protein RHM67_09535 [Mucilaginibacter sp. 5C4]
MIQTEAEAIAKEFDNDKERIERYKLSIDNMSKLIGKGTEIHPSLLAPENVSNLFPAYKNLNLIESKTKKISNE